MGGGLVTTIQLSKEDKVYLSSQKVEQNGLQIIDWIEEENKMVFSEFYFYTQLP